MAGEDEAIKEVIFPDRCSITTRSVFKIQAKHRGNDLQEKHRTGFITRFECQSIRTIESPDI